MNLKKLLTYVGPIFLVLYLIWYHFDIIWWTQLSVICTLTVVSWTLGYFCYDQLNQEMVENPGSLAVLITGCDTGFGHEVALKLDQYGFNVFAGVYAPDGPGAAKLQSTCSSRLRLTKMDVTSQADVERVASEILHSKLPLWAVINNAGIGVSGFLDWGRDVEEFKKVFEVNVFGVVRTTKNCLPLLRETKGSRVVNVASLAGRITAPCLGHYSMTKHSVRSFSDALRRELYMTKDKVHVVTVEPTFYKTAIIDGVNGSQARDRLWNETPESIKVSYPEYFLQRQKRSQAKINRAARTNLNEVIDTLVDAVRLLEPKHYYRCCGYLDVVIWAISHGPEIVLDIILKIRGGI